MGIVPVESGTASYSENSLTYKADFEGGTIAGMCDRLEAVKQAVYKILSTQRYDYMIYNRDYGIELNDLIGKSYAYISALIKGRICEALMCDDRINDVCDFDITRNTDSLTVSFTVVSIFGESSITKEFAL